MSLALVVVAWLVVGALCVVLLRRKGHDAFTWSILFLFLGPLAVPLAATAGRTVPPEPDGPRRDGRLDVLVAHDGSRDASAALDAAVAMLSPAVTSVTLAAVVTVEATTTLQGRATVEECRTRLEEAARRLAAGLTVPVDTVVLHGEPAAVLDRYARNHGYEIIVIGSSPRRASHVGAGSVARRLSTGATVPVLFGPSPA